MANEGTIIAWSSADSIGRVQLAEGEVLRFGGSACARFVPKVGLAVRVLGSAPHPLGGRRATALELVDAGDADRVLDEEHPLVGIDPSPEVIQEFLSFADEVSLLGIVLRQPLRSRGALRAWFARAGVKIDFQQPKAPVVRAGDALFRVDVCMAPLGGGGGIVSFGAATPFSVRRERSLALARASLPPGGRVSTIEHYGPLESMVRACAAGEHAVVAHQAPGYVLPVDTWCDRAAVRPTKLPLDAWTRATRSPGGDAMFVGMAALHLPDLFLRGAPLDADVVLAEAASALVALGRMPTIGERLGRAAVVSSDEEWVALAT